MLKSIPFTDLLRKYAGFFIWLFAVLIICIISVYSIFVGTLHSVGFKISDIEVNYVLQAFDFGDFLSIFLPALSILIVFYLIGDLVNFMENSKGYSKKVKYGCLIKRVRRLSKLFKEK